MSRCVDDSFIGERVAELRSARGWTQQVLAERAGLSVSTIAKIEQGGTYRIATLVKVADVLDVSLTFAQKQPTPTARTASVRSSLRAPVDTKQLALGLGQRLLQVALDVPDLERACSLANATAAAGADLLEVGDPLIKRFGMDAVRRVRSTEPEVPMIVELSSSDWADDQVGLAAEAGADLVLLLGLRRSPRIERAMGAARRHGVGCIVGLPADVDVGPWCRMAQGHGVDGIAVIRSIDNASSAADSLRLVHSVRRATTLPIAVSGGFTPSEVEASLSLPWNLIIVGRAVVQAPDPSAVVQQLARALQGYRSRR